MVKELVPHMKTLSQGNRGAGSSPEAASQSEYVPYP